MEGEIDFLHGYLLPPDRQTERAVCRCAGCGGALYRGELIWLFRGGAFCPDCCPAEAGTPIQWEEEME